MQQASGCDGGIAADVRRLEELTLATAPSLNEEHYDGWVLRASGNDTRRANSVTALESSAVLLPDKVVYCESWYRRYRQAAIFRLNDILSPMGLDSLLELRGYRREEETMVMTAELAPERMGFPRLENGFRFSGLSVEKGIAFLNRLKGESDDLLKRDVQRQALWQGEQAFVVLERDGEVVSCGMVRREGDHLGIFGMYTTPAMRCKGLAKQTMHRLLAWGRASGARVVFLQVDSLNSAAHHVYRHFGFETRYRYWYRVQSVDHA